MIKRLCLVLVMFMTASCTNGRWFWEEPPEEPAICPLMNLRDTSYAKFVQHSDSFQIILVGYNGSCFIDPVGKSSRAIIEPIFIIRRLKAGDEVNVPFKFYTETTYGPAEYITKQVYSEVATMPEFMKEIRFLGKKVQVRVPEVLRRNYAINMGLIIEPVEQIYNNRSFNNSFDYSEEK